MERFNKKIIGGIVLAAILVTATFSLPTASADLTALDKIGTIINLLIEIKNLLLDADFGLDAIDNEVEKIEGKLDAVGCPADEAGRIDDIECKLDDSDFGLDAIDNEVEKIEGKLDAEGCPANEDGRIDDIECEVNKIEGKLDAEGCPANEDGRIDDIECEVIDIQDNALRLVRVTLSIADGADDEYDGTITFDRTTGTGAFQIEELYLCGAKLGDELADELNVNYSSGDGFLVSAGGTGALESVFVGSGSEAGCFDLLNPQLAPSDTRLVRLLLGGDGSTSPNLLLTETDADSDDDSTGATIVAYIIGLTSPSDMTVTSTTANS